MGFDLATTICDSHLPEYIKFKSTSICCHICMQTTNCLKSNAKIFKSNVFSIVCYNICVRIMRNNKNLMGMAILL